MPDPRFAAASLQCNVQRKPRPEPTSSSKQPSLSSVNRCVFCDNSKVAVHIVRFVCSYYSGKPARVFPVYYSTRLKESGGSETKLCSFDNLLHLPCASGYHGQRRGAEHRGRH